MDPTIDEAKKEFREGLTHLTNQYPDKALPHLAKAVQLDKRNPLYLSYLGLCLATWDKKRETAEEMCYSAVRMKRSQPELYVNLSEVYRIKGKRQEAVETLLQGLPLTRRDPRLVRALRRYGYRRAPVLPFLSRENFLNKNLGRIRYKVLKSLGREV